MSLSARITDLDTHMLATLTFSSLCGPDRFGNTIVRILYAMHEWNRLVPQGL